MTKIELTLSPNYVESWTVVDAIRELFQNAIDQEKQFPDNEMSWIYEFIDNKLTISNKSSKLDKSSLLLGGTTKSDDPTTIGQFGEGYKIATLVLLRNGKNVTFYNHGCNEIWKPRFINSRKFGAKILAFMIEKYAIWSHPIDNDLSIEIDNITRAEYDEICKYNLHVAEEYDPIESNEFGEVLIDMPGMVFVNGLYVCEYKPYHYGYNFMPQHIKLDRDRKMASDFDLKWLASRLWAQSKQYDLIHKMLNIRTGDVEYLEYTNNNLELSEAIYTAFVTEHGKNAVPIVTQSELDSLPNGKRGIMVSSGYKAIYASSTRYEPVEPVLDESSPVYELYDWFESVKSALTTTQIDEFETIFKKLKS